MTWLKAVPEGVRLDRLNESMRENPREDGEDVVSWLERVNITAGEMILSQCQEITFKGERIVGEDDE